MKQWNDFFIPIVLEVSSFDKFCALISCAGICLKIIFTESDVYGRIQSNGRFGKRIDLKIKYHRTFPCREFVIFISFFFVYVNISKILIATNRYRQCYGQIAVHRKIELKFTKNSRPVS